MLQTLLRDRFSLKWHFEKREVKGYALRVARRGSKLGEPVSLDSGKGVRLNGAPIKSLEEVSVPGGISMTRLASRLSGHHAIDGLPVIDQTEVKGLYSFELTFSTEEGDERPSIFTAVREQLGLELKAGKIMTEVLVIDGISRPTPN